MTAAPLTLDACDPDWPDDATVTDRTPTRADCRQHEIRDMRGQAVGPLALWTATTIPTGSYL